MFTVEILHEDHKIEYTLPSFPLGILIVILSTQFKRVEDANMSFIIPILAVCPSINDWSNW